MFVLILFCGLDRCELLRKGYFEGRHIKKYASNICVKFSIKYSGRFKILSTNKCTLLLDT